jgi:hypothetical protein
MRFQKQRKICRSMQGVFALTVATLLVQLFPVNAEGSTALKIETPIKYKKYHVHYDVNADGTYTNSDELALTVLTEQGVIQSGQMPIGLRNAGMSMGNNRDIEILTAYTLKKSGEHIDAVQLSQNNGTVGAAGTMPMPAPRQMQLKFIAFQNVEIGDTLVLSYKIQKEPISAHDIVLSEYFPEYLAFDDAIISLTAPASLHLRIETVGVGKAEDSSTTDTQKLVWKYQNLEPKVISDPGHLMLPSASTPRIHISSFKDNAAEMAAMNNSLTPVAPPSLKDMGCNILWKTRNDGPDGMEALKGVVGAYFWNNETLLQEVADKWINPECMLDDGRPMLTALDYGYGMAFENQPDWSASLNRVEYLKKKFPDKAFVVLAEAIYWSDYAWNARGEGLASSVTPEGWRLFHERLEKAEKVLIDTKSYASQMPAWYDEMILVQSALGRPAEERDKTFLEGARKFRTYYPTYFTMLNFLTPKWGGSWDAVDTLVKWSVDNTKETDGNSMYARLYWSASGGLIDGTSLFRDTRASWPKMKQGFEDLMARHLRSKWNLNNYARFACMANDQSTFLKLRSQIGKDVIAAAWPPNVSLDLCETKFGYSQ